MKAFANREQDWLDIKGILIRQQSTGLDWDYVIKFLEPLSELKEKAKIMNRLTAEREASEE